MSTNRNCVVFEYALGCWYYAIEEYWGGMRTYGPFTGEASLREHLRREHANPGAEWYVTLSGRTPPGYDRRTLDAFVAEATPPKPTSRTVSSRRWD